MSIGVRRSLPHFASRLTASTSLAWLYAVRRLTGIDAVSRSQVAGIPETAHLARQLQHDDGIEILPTSASSAGPDPPTPIAILQDRLQRLGLMREFKYIDALAPFIHILASPFVGSLFGRILEGIAGRSLWTHNLLMLAPLSSDGSPAVWYEGPQGFHMTNDTVAYNGLANDSLCLLYLGGEIVSDFLCGYSSQTLWS